MLSTFYLALCCLPLVCEAGSYCYVEYYPGYNYVCIYSLSTVDRFGIAYGTVAGIGLLVSLIIFVACKSRQSRPNNSAILQHPNAAYVQSASPIYPTSGKHSNTSTTHCRYQSCDTERNQQLAAPQNTITNPASPLINQQRQIPGTESAVTSTMGAEGLTVMLPEAQKDETETEDPPPYSV